ncbi:OmpA family protein [Rhodovarius crocodyli]|uniref:OmpA family protein n=1 Tax=Rhodovarius crocodyli TaxID=1979269 RepID=A0A437MM98_9PROT|nr:OmpA family protein [Rhodovarius crocodyli]RVT98784.1 OmpA family protein [Rhodovarius crocodyli]
MNRRHLLLAPLALALPGCEAITGFIGGPSSQPPAIVFFEGFSADIPDSAMENLRGAAATAARYPTSRVLVMGFAGPTGGQAYNQQLSQQRANAVAAKLRELGVAPERIAIQARGPVSFDLVELESRRVEIRFGE